MFSLLLEVLDRQILVLASICLIRTWIKMVPSSTTLSKMMSISKNTTTFYLNLQQETKVINDSIAVRIKINFFDS